MVWLAWPWGTSPPRWARRAGGSQRRTAFLVRRERTRVVVRVLVGTELQRIDEDAGDHEVGALAGFLHQRDMTGVEVAHGRHETDAFALAARAGDRGAQVGDGLDDVHAEKPCSAAGNSTALTALT